MKKTERCVLTVMKKLFCCVLAAILLLSHGLLPALATEQSRIYPYDFAFEDFWYREDVPASSFESSLPRKSALLMEASTGKVLFADNENERLPIASVTKVMATLLIMEAIDQGKVALSDVITVSERAASMGGSQVFLESGEQMTVDDLLKSLIVVSANDATVALAEAVYGSEEAFIAAMNEKSKELGLENTHFVNTNGLPAEGHYSSALDVAITTRALLEHPTVLNYTGIWMDTIRNGAFGLANTNKLVRFYKGANGMKTGFTSEAGYCLSATAKRDGMQLIAVVLGSPTSEDRFALAKQLLDFGFANYRVSTPEVELPAGIPVTMGVADQVSLTVSPPSLLLEKGAAGNLSVSLDLPDSVSAPVEKGQALGTVSFLHNGTLLAKTEIRAAESVKKIGLGTMIRRIFGNIFGVL